MTLHDATGKILRLELKALLSALALFAITLSLSTAAYGENPNQNPVPVVRPEFGAIGGVKVAIWRPLMASKVPLVLFSHGFHGSYKQSKFLMEALARNGFLAIAPNHADANRLSGGAGGRPDTSFQQPRLWTSGTHVARLNDLKALIRGLKTEPAWSGVIDWLKVGVAGHSLGGYAALGVGGAWEDWRIPEIKAVLALSPYSQPFIQKNTLGKLAVPVMYQGGTKDFGTTPAIKKNEGAYSLSSAPKYFVNFDGAGHFAWTDLNSKYHSSIEYYSLAFFNAYLKGESWEPLKAKRSDVAELLYEKGP